jgi:hypothetical protein
MKHIFNAPVNNVFENIIKFSNDLGVKKRVWCLVKGLSYHVKLLNKNYKQAVFSCHNNYNDPACFKNVNNCLNTNTYSYLETSGGQSFNLYLKLVHFFNTSVK